METQICCAQCGSSLENGDAFCPDCGARTAAASSAAPSGTCPECGEPIETMDEYCASCGHHLDASTATPTLAAPTIPLIQTPLPIGSIPPPAADPVIALQAIDGGNALLPETTTATAASVSATTGSESPRKPLQAQSPIAIETLSFAPNRAYTVEPRNDRSEGNSNVGWAIIAAVVILGGGVVTWAISTSQRKSDALHGVVAASWTPATPVATPNSAALIRQTIRNRLRQNNQRRVNQYDPQGAQVMEPRMQPQPPTNQNTPQYAPPMDTGANEAYVPQEPQRDPHVDQLSNLQIQFESALVDAQLSRRSGSSCSEAWGNMESCINQMQRVAVSLPPDLRQAADSAIDRDETTLQTEKDLVQRWR